MYLFQTKFTWDSQWTTIHGDKWGKHGHATPMGALLQQSLYKIKNKDSNVYDKMEFRVINADNNRIISQS